MINYTYIIRKAEKKDAKNIRIIMENSFKVYEEMCSLNRISDDPFMLDALSETIEDIEKDILGKTIFLATIDDIPVGTVRIKILNKKTAYISRFGVMPEYHNIGVGKSLMNLADKYLISKGISEVYLYTAATYSDLVRFYYGRGFYVDSTTKDRGYIRAKMCKKYILK